MQNYLHEHIRTLEINLPIWERVFTAAPLVLVGTKQAAGYDFVPKHMGMPLGWQNYFVFVCTPRHRTQQNIEQEKAFTVSYPRPTQLVLTSLAAAPAVLTVRSPYPGFPEIRKSRAAIINLAKKNRASTALSAPQLRQENCEEVTIRMLIQRRCRMSLQQFCKRTVVTIAPDQPIAEACQLLREKNVGCLVATEGDKVQGILTDRDIALKVVGEKKDPQRTTVREIMSPNPTRIPVTKSLHDLTTLMHTHHVRRVPIVDDGDKVLGIVTLDDLLMLLGEEMSDMGKGIAGALFRKPSPNEPVESEMVLGWLMSYL